VAGGMREVGPVRCKWENTFKMEFHPREALEMQTGLNCLRTGSVGELLYDSDGLSSSRMGFCKISLKCTNMKLYFTFCLALGNLDLREGDQKIPGII
jgi:hypothetical protein